MKGPDHYREAQRRLALQTVPGQTLQEPPSETDIAAAQAHATLALAAALVDAANAVVTGNRVDDEWAVIAERRGW